MPIPLETRYYPADFQLLTVTIGGPSLTQYPIFHADRDCVIDSVTLYFEEAPSTARDMKVKLMASTDGLVVNTIPTYATTSQDFSTAAKNFSITAGDYPQTHVFALDTSKNLIRQGSKVWIQASGALAGVSGSISVQVRWRSQV